MPNCDQCGAPTYAGSDGVEALQQEMYVELEGQKSINKKLSDELRAIRKHLEIQTTADRWRDLTSRQKE